jgi:SNF2 family DNA or RNA helicase
VLIFSKTKIFLDLFEQLIALSGYAYGYLRLDGSVPISER